MLDTNSNWINKDRSETDSFRMPDRMIGNIKVSNPALGINIYSNVFDNGKEIIEILNNKSNSTKIYKWSPIKYHIDGRDDYFLRHCTDLKFNKSTLGAINESNSDLHYVYDTVLNNLNICVKDYSNYWDTSLEYYEIFNFIKYESGIDQFKIHTDDAKEYSARTSACIYFNDDYEGGEIGWPRFNLKIKPKAGDIILFPSNYIYEHETFCVNKGTKYCCVVAMDFSDAAHKGYKGSK